MNPEERQLTDLEEADTLFDLAESLYEDADTARRLGEPVERIHALLTEAGEAHRAAWEAKRRGEGR